MTVAEALANQTPAIVSHGAPWEGLVSEDCGWWYPIGEEPLRDALVQAMQSSPAQLEEMGQKGRAWMSREFGWPALSQRMEGVYEWLSERGERPDCVVVD